MGRQDMILPNFHKNCNKFDTILVAVGEGDFDLPLVHLQLGVLNYFDCHCGGCCCDSLNICDKYLVSDLRL